MDSFPDSSVFIERVKRQLTQQQEEQKRKFEEQKRQKEERLRLERLEYENVLNTQKTTLANAVNEALADETKTKIEVLFSEPIKPEILTLVTSKGYSYKMESKQSSKTDDNGKISHVETFKLTLSPRNELTCDNFNPYYIYYPYRLI